jgi:hypothetical protein
MRIFSVTVMISDREKCKISMAKAFTKASKVIFYDK